MIARVRLALNAAHLTDAELAAGALEQCERLELAGDDITPTGDTIADWAAARAAVAIPEGARVIYWLREE